MLISAETCIFIEHSHKQRLGSYKYNIVTWKDIPINKSKIYVSKSIPTCLIEVNDVISAASSNFSPMNDRTVSYRCETVDRPVVILIIVTISPSRFLKTRTRGENKGWLLFYIAE